VCHFCCQVFLWDTCVDVMIVAFGDMVPFRTNGLGRSTACFLCLRRKYSCGGSIPHETTTLTFVSQNLEFRVAPCMNGGIIRSSNRLRRRSCVSHTHLPKTLIKDIDQYSSAPFVQLLWALPVLGSVGKICMSFRTCIMSVYTNKEKLISLLLRWTGRCPYV
jgi:hypothetical protein